MAEKEKLEELFKELNRLKEEQERTETAMSKQFMELTRQALEEGVEDLALERQIEEKERLIREQEQRIASLRKRITRELEKEYGRFRTAQEIAKERTRLARMAEEGRLSRTERDIRMGLLTIRMNEINSGATGNVKASAGYLGAVFSPEKIEETRQGILEKMSELRSELPRLKEEREQIMREVAGLMKKVKTGTATEKDKKRIKELMERERSLTEKALNAVHTLTVQEATLASLQKAGEMSRARLAAQRKRDLEKLRIGEEIRKRGKGKRR